MDGRKDEAKTDILLLITDLGVGGAQKVFREQADLLSDRYRVTEVVFDLDEPPAFPGKNRLVNLAVGGGGGPLRKLLNFNRRVKRMRSLGKASGAKLCISHLPGADYVNLLSRAPDMRTIVVAHGSRSGNRESAATLFGRLVRLVEPRLYCRADMVVSVSRALRAEFLESGVPADQVCAINNFFDHEGIRQKGGEPLSPTEKSLFGDRPVIATIGRLSLQKNQEQMLEVFAGVRRERPARLLVLGDGPLRNKLTARATDLGLDWWAAWEGKPLEGGRDLYFLGNDHNPFRWLSRSDLFVLSSGWEGFPLALCEAMILGVPVVSSDCPTGPREILAPDTALDSPPLRDVEHAPNGVLMPLLADDDVESRRIWVRTIVRLLDSTEERDRYGKAAAARAEDFTRERIAAQWFELVERLLAKA